MSYRKLIKLAARFSNKYAMGEKEVFDHASVLEEVFDEYEIPEFERDKFRDNSGDLLQFSDKITRGHVKEYFSALVNPELSEDKAIEEMDRILAKYDGREDDSSDEEYPSDEEYQEYKDDIDTIFKGLKDLYSNEMESVSKSLSEKDKEALTKKLKALALELLKKGIKPEDVEEYLSYEADIQPDLDREEAKEAQKEVIERYRHIDF